MTTGSGSLSGASAPGEYRPDQAAVDWARERVERAVAKWREFERTFTAKGDIDAARRARFAANVMERELIGGGCVVGPFDQRAVKVQNLIDGVL